jgi:hypothetical protein
MYKILMMVNIDLTGTWADVFNRDSSKNGNIITINDAKSYVSKIYGHLLTNYTFENSDTELFVISETDIGCINCGS